MTDTDELCQNLQSVWDNHFPMVGAMGVRVESFSDHTLTTRTPLAGNTNIHGSAFAGSLYAIEALTAWGLLYLELAMAGLDGSIIHASGNIEFAKPVEEDIVAVSRFHEHGDVLTELAETGKVRLTMTSEALAGGDPVSRFSGAYAVRLAAQ